MCGPQASGSKVSGSQLPTKSLSHPAVHTACRVILTHSFEGCWAKRMTRRGFSFTQIFRAHKPFKRILNPEPEYRGWLGTRNVDLTCGAYKHSALILVCLLFWVRVRPTGARSPGQPRTHRLNEAFPSAEPALCGLKAKPFKFPPSLVSLLSPPAREGIIIPEAQTRKLSSSDSFQLRSNTEMVLGRGSIQEAGLPGLCYKRSRGLASIDPSRIGWGRGQVWKRTPISSPASTGQFCQKKILQRTQLPSLHTTSHSGPRGVKPWCSGFTQRCFWVPRGCRENGRGFLGPEPPGNATSCELRFIHIRMVILSSSGKRNEAGGLRSWLEITKLRRQAVQPQS